MWEEVVLKSGRNQSSLIIGKYLKLNNITPNFNFIKSDLNNIKINFNII